MMHTVNNDIVIDMYGQISNYLRFQHSSLSWIIEINHIQLANEIIEI